MRSDQRRQYCYSLRAPLLGDCRHRQLRSVGLCMDSVRLMTHEDACRAHNNIFPCARVHFERLIFPWTDVALGNCSYLDTCRHMKTCRYVHYQLDDQPDVMTSEAAGSAAKPKAAVPSYLAVSTC